MENSWTYKRETSRYRTDSPPLFQKAIKNGGNGANQWCSFNQSLYKIMSCQRQRLLFQLSCKKYFQILRRGRELYINMIIFQVQVPTLCPFITISDMLQYHCSYFYYLRLLSMFWPYYLRRICYLFVRTITASAQIHQHIQYTLIIHEQLFFSVSGKIITYIHGTLHVFIN